MKRTIIISVICAAMAAFSACSTPVTGSAGSRSHVPAKEFATTEMTQGTVQDTAARRFGELSHPDVKIHVKRGHPLALQTDGLLLTAVDASVQREADYSVTSLVAEELPPLPQGMINMTAATAGYRLLPGGEHFLPYAVLRMTYDPGRLPEGYTPDDIYTSFYDSSAHTWIRLERVEVDTVNREIVSLTTHFTDFINELLKAPEMPETKAFVPTAMTDLEAVSPMDGLPLLTPPEANTEGSANLSYPIQIPSGRAGMQPNLSVNYNSGGGNGWLGVGWDLSVPAITLDTRWGVPRYDATFETEIYLLAGEQLITRDDDGNPRPMPHRTNRQTTRSSLGDDVRFYARTGDAHDSIIRHNTLTSDYWWEVVDRNGITHYYGHYPDSSLNTPSHPTTIGDNHGNIAKWMLAESRDAYGNWVRYHYTVETSLGANPGRQIYLDSITYTGHGKEKGLYSILFERKYRNQDDRPLSCNYGFKEKTDYILCNIAIKFRDTTITSYYFETECGYASNFKTRLKAISKLYNAKNTNEVWTSLKDICSSGLSSFDGEYTRQEFEYYDNPSMDTLFGDVRTMNVESDDIKGFMLRPGYRIDSVDHATALGLSHTSSWNVGGTVAVGLGPVICHTKNSIGGNYTRSGSSSETLLTLIDLDGDGLSDKVFVKDGDMYWRKQTMSADGDISYGDLHTVSGAKHFLLQKNTTNTFGAQASVKVTDSLGISGSGSWSKTTSITSTYFADVNGDGLVDIVSNGFVYFNYLEDGQPTFTIFLPVRPQDDGDEPQEAPSQIPTSNCGGIIFDGEVNDTVVCQTVLRPCDLSSVMDSAEAFQYCEQYQNETMPARPVLFPEGYRVVHFCRELDCSRRNLAMYGVPNTEAVRVWVAPEDGMVTMQTYIRLIEDTSQSRVMSRHTDGVTYTIQHSSGVTATDSTLQSTSDTVIMSQYICQTCYRDDDFDDSYDSTVSFRVNRGDIIFFRLQSNDDKQFDNVEDHISIFLEEKEYKNDNSFILTENKYFQAPYNGHYIIDGYYQNPNSNSELIIVQPTTRHITASTTIINESDTIGRDSIILLAVVTNDEQFNWGSVDLRARIRYWSDSLPDTMTVWTPGTKFIIHPSGSIWRDRTYQRLFGNLYNGWGQFAYNPAGETTNSQYIRLENLILPKLMITDSTTDTSGMRDRINEPINDPGFEYNDISDFANVNGDQYTPISDSSCWVEMTADAEHNRWVSFGAQNSIGCTNISNSIQKEWYSSASLISNDSAAFLPPEVEFDDPLPALPDGIMAKTILKVSRSTNFGMSLGIKGFGNSGSYGKNTVELDYMDLNGDRYPDIVGTDYVQYSSQWGGLGELTLLREDLTNASTSISASDGFSFGASTPKHSRIISSNPKTAKYSLDSDGSAGGGFSLGNDNTNSTWTDINGDGLPDIVYKNGTVRLNTGYDFLDAENWNFDGVQSGRCTSKSEDLGLSALGEALTNNNKEKKFNIYQGSIQLGAALGRSVNRVTQSFIDINGDGLLDIVWRRPIEIDINGWSDILNPADSVHVSLNLGGGRWSQSYDMNIKKYNWSESYNESLNLGFTIGVTFFGTFKATFGANGTPYSSSVSRDRMQLVDVNADGLPDLVTSDSEDRLYVRYNKAGRTNLLKKVTNFTGSRIHIEYTLSSPCYEQPSRGWMMTAVMTKDPLNPNGGDTTVTRFEYSNPHYDRFERTSFGYGKVVTKQINPSDGSVYRTVTREFHNENILVKGRPKRELTSDGQENKYIEKIYQYNYAAYDGGAVDSCSGNAFSVRDRVVTRFYEGSTSPKITTEEAFEYDRYHNVVKYIDEGDTAYSDDGLRVDFTYYSSKPNNLIGLRQDYKVYPTGSLSPKRQAQFQYNNQGKLTKQTMGSGPDTAVYDFYYDSVYGNMIQAHLPKNDSNQRMVYNYTYDPFVHTYPDSITNSYGEVTTTTYNYRLCRPVAITDPSGNTMSYDYDCLGRIIAVRSPLNNSAIPSLRNFYHSKGCLEMYHIHPYSITEHYDDNGNLITRTVVITDGFGRVLQTKKGLTEDGVPSMQVSGRAIVDHFGRTTRQYDPFTIADTSLVSLGVFEPYMDSSATVTHYDILDRATSVCQPLNGTTHNYYNIMNDADGQRRFYTQTTDPYGNVSEQYSDYDGRQVQVTSDVNGIAATTTMHYDNLGQLEHTVDPEGFTTYYGYDNLGRLTYRNHPDAGITTYDYDPAGNLIRESNPLGQINYDYTYYRPRHKRYSYMTGNDVEYTYGTSGNETGRLVHIVDGSGSYECFYDALGNVTEDIRTIALPGSDEVYRFKTQYTYDSWGRMDQMAYPDGEVVSYKYIWGGDLFAMDGDKNGTLQSYIKGIHYNKFGQRDSVQYGNGTRAHYTYDALHRLYRLTSFQLGGAVMQNIKYTFDSVNNIKRIKDSVLAIGTLGGGYDNTFNYDGLHRLEGSQGDNTLGHYRYTMDYTASGRIKNKRLETPSSSLTGSVNMFYGYCNDQKPHTVRRIFDEKNEKHFDLRWDDAGNLGQISIGNEDAKFETGRFLFWTEDNRMHAAVDEKYSSYYVYDHSGERRVKLTGTNDLLDVNADYMYTASVLREPTIYPSAYMVMSNRGYTKHYYAGAERVAARIGGGGLKVIDQEHGLSDKSGSVFKQSLRQINDRILENNDINCIANGLSSNDKLTIDMNEVPERLQAELITDYDEFRQMIADAQSIHHNEPDVYFYHSDHLGSASWITDNGGLAVQHLQYLPYGERYVDQRISGYSERFTFTGKEKDSESGFYYFGARYYDCDLSGLFLSVDPMSDKYPSLSPYAYCAWNPVRLVDPDGREFGDIYNLRGQHIGSDRRNDNVVYLKSTWSNRQLSTVESNFLIMFGGVKNITEETGLTNDELNLRATLSTIKQAEAGRKNPPLDYNSWNGSDHFTEDSYVDNPKAYARHPGTNPNTKRSASGAYQFLKRFWDSDDFSPQAQDKAAVNLMTKSGYEAALNGDMAGFINSSSKRWTSLSQWEVSDLQDEFYYNRAKELVGKTNIATPIGSLLKKK